MPLPTMPLRYAAPAVPYFPPSRNMAAQRKIVLILASYHDMELTQRKSYHDHAADRGDPQAQLGRSVDTGAQSSTASVSGECETKSLCGSPALRPTEICLFAGLLC